MERTGDTEGNCICRVKSLSLGTNFKKSGHILYCIAKLFKLLATKMLHCTGTSVDSITGYVAHIGLRTHFHTNTSCPTHQLTVNFAHLLIILLV